MKNKEYQIATPKDNPGTGKIETVYYFFLLGFSKVFAYGVLLILANLFILQDYGQASFVMSIFKIATLFSSIGLPFIFVPWVISKREVSSIFYFLLFFNLILMGGGIAIGIKYPWTLPIIFAIPLMVLGGISNSILRIKHKYSLIQLFSVLLEAYTLVSLLFLLKYGKAGIILGNAIAIYITNMSSIYLTRKELLGMAKTFNFDLNAIWAYTKKGTITLLLYLSFAFLNWIDSIVLGILSTFENVAKYNVAGPVSNVLTIIPYSLAMFLLTRESEVKSKKLSKSILKRSLRISFSLSLLLTLFLLSFIFPIIKIFFPKYSGVEIYIMILSLGLLFYSIYSLIYVYQTGKLNPEKVFLPITLAAILNIILDIILIPKYGLYGITCATTISHALAFFILAYKMDLLKEFSPMLGMLVFVPLTYYAGVIGLLLIPVALLLLHLTNLLQEGDIFTVVNTFFSIFEKFK